MDNKKFEQLIDLIINENEEQARALFHDIVVEKSREIYESMMDTDEGLGGQVGGLLDEIEVEESGMMEDDDDLESDELGIGDDGMGPQDGLEVDDEGVAGMGDMDAADMGAMDADVEAGEEDLEDRVVDLEEKLDQLMAEFEEIMNGEDDEEEGEADFEAGEEEEEAGEEEEEAGEEEEEAGEEAGEEEEDGTGVMESKEAKQVAVPVVHNKSPKSTSPALKSPAFKHGSAHPVNFTRGDGGGKHGDVSVGASPVKNPANKAGQKNVDLSPAPAAKKAASSGQNTRSPVAESKAVKTTKAIRK